MEEKVVYVTGNKLNVLYDGKISELSSQVYQRYIKNTNEIKDRNKWKTSGEGALFTGSFDYETLQGASDDGRFNITGITFSSRPGKFIYSSVIGDFSCIYFKDYTDENEIENLIYSNNNIKIQDLSFKNNKILASLSSESVEYHIALFDLNGTGYDILTDGDTVDENPWWSSVNENTIYYNCKGIGRDNNGKLVGFSPRYICKLNRIECTVDDILNSGEYEYIKPKEDFEGNLYYIRMPFKANKKKISFKDIFLAPVRLLKGIFGFLDIFTQRYSGESLKSSGNNPAKSRTMSEKDLFIEGNLINVEKTLKENQNSKEKYPGIAPKNWELRCIDRNGDDICIKKGVLDYTFAENGCIYYSNGQYIIKIDNSSEETLIAKSPLVSKIIITDT